jgi:septal ring-binding cell division protein DamX
VLLIVGIGSALKAPSTNSTEQTASAEKSINLSGNDASIRRMAHSLRRVHFRRADRR